MTALELQGFELHPWQQEAVRAWAEGPRPFHGTLEIFTGGGKTLIAVACVAEAARRDPGLRFAVVVPTEALAHQWRRSLLQHTDLPEHEIGLLGAGGSDVPSDHRALVAVLNTASKRLPQLVAGLEPFMLVVDECHRAGAPSFSRVLSTPAAYRLGLSATPEREELEESGEPLEYDDQLVGRLLGPVVYRFSLRDARRIGWLPDYELHHHGLALTPDERGEYEAASRRVDELLDQLRAAGVDRARAQQLQRRQDPVGELARSYVAATSRRKDLLYRAGERNRIAALLVRQLLAESADRRILLFHERVGEAVQLYRMLTAGGSTPGGAAEPLPQMPEVRLEHSRLPDRERARALDDFRSGTASVLVSVKSLIEGIDVPDADVGISVASSASVRQRVQSLGRVLRRQFEVGGRPKQAEMHLLYVADTVDELIYRKEDWSDLTGEGRNRYWRWSLDPNQPPVPQEGPPATPHPTEEQEWERLGGRPPIEPVQWFGDLIGQEYSVDTLGTVRNHFGRVIANPQDVGAQVASVRKRPGGRFRITPVHGLVLVTSDDRDDPKVYVTGGISEPFEARDDEPADADVKAAELRPGDPYPGPSDDEGGTYHLRLKRGGVIERKSGQRGLEFALTQGTGRPELEANAHRLLEAWKTVLDRGVTVQVNSLGHAWYRAEGERRFLAQVPGGFVWPSDEEQMP